MARFLWVCFGSAVGGGARYVVSVWMLRALGPAFPFATLTVNLVGSFCVGALVVVGIETTLVSPTVRLALITGVMGGFTTYSTFSFESLKYFQDGAWGMGVLNVLVTVLGCLGACLLGWTTGRWLVGA